MVGGRGFGGLGNGLNEIHRIERDKQENTILSEYEKGVITQYPLIYNENILINDLSVK